MQSVALQATFVSKIDANAVVYRSAWKYYISMHCNWRNTPRIFIVRGVTEAAVTHIPVHELFPFAC